jgi:DNA-binding NtrC family response regulator
MANVLVIDDEKAMRELMTTAMLMEGHHVQQARDGSHGLNQLTKQTFDLVITDLRMPEMDGITMVESMRQRGIRTPTLIVTGYPPADGLHGTSTRSTIQKPFLISHLATAAREALAEGRTPGGGCSSL